MANEKFVNKELELIANKMAAAVTRCTRDLRYAWANERYGEWIHRSPKELVGAKIQDMLGSEAFLRLLPYFERVLSGETTAYVEKIAFAGIGERWIHAIYTPTFNSEGKSDGWIAVVRDITAEKATEAALLNRDQQLLEEARSFARLNECCLRLWQIRNLKEGLAEMLRAVIELLEADKGNVQMVDPDKTVLTIVAQQGFEQEFLDHFREVSAADDSACGRAIRKHERVIMEDVENDAGFAPHRQVARAAGFRAVVSSPLIARDGKVLGMLSTHFRSAHRPSDQQLRRLELYTRQAADFIERCKGEEDLRLSVESYRKLTKTLDGEVRARTRELERRNLDVLSSPWCKSGFASKDF